MKLSFKQIELCNFLSFGYAEISLSDRGYTLVSGINTNVTDNAKSNGAGKSTIWEAIVWCLTGDTVRGGSKDIRNIHAEDGAYVKLTFTADNNTYELIRSKEHSEYKTNLKIFINGEDKSGKGIRDSEKLLAEYLPDLTAALIGSVIILGQGLPQRFSNNTPAGRKEILEKLSKSDFMIEDLKTRVTKRKELLSQKMRQVDEKRISAVSNYNYIKEELQRNLHSLSELQSNDQLINEVNTLSKTFETYKKVYDELLAQSDLKNREYAELQTRLYDAKLVFSNKLTELKTPSKEELLLTDEKNQLSGKITALELEIRQLESIRDICPTCGQKLINVIKPDTSSKKVQLDAEQKRFYELKNRLQHIDADKQQKIDEYSKQMYSSIDDLQESLSKISTELNQIKEKTKSSYQDKEYISKELQKKQASLAAFEENKHRLDQMIKTQQETIVQLDKEILYNTNEEADLQKHLDIINKFNTIITRDFRGFLLKNIIDFINRKAKEYSLEVFNTDKIDFTLDGNNINISYDQKFYEDLSGGEKQKIDLIIQFSLRDMLCSFLNFSSNILVIDEVFDNLDTIGCQKIIDLISTKLIDIDSIYIVTHRGDLTIPYDNEIVVIKDNSGVSRIK